MGIADTMEMKLRTQWNCGHYGNKLADTMGIADTMVMNLRTQWDADTMGICGRNGA